jgi:6-pyruvoyltetrahydropterin/6-carboxytetrahydropterin synthase
MYDIAVEQEFSAAHQLHGYAGKCENLHGHNWRVRLEVTAKQLDQVGLGIDFTILKSILKNILEEYDHKVLNQLPLFKKDNPTSENLARIIFIECRKALRKYPVRMKQVMVWESERAFVRYYA